MYTISEKSNEKAKCLSTIITINYQINFPRN